MSKNISIPKKAKNTPYGEYWFLKGVEVGLKEALKIQEQYNKEH